MPLSPPKTDPPRNGARSAWGPPPAEQPVVEPTNSPPALLLPAHLVIDPESLAGVCAHVKAAVAQAVREGVAEGFSTAWPEDQPASTAPPAAR